MEPFMPPTPSLPATRNGSIASGCNEIESAGKQQMNRSMSRAELNLQIVIIIGFTLRAVAQPTTVPPSARESIEWCDIWISHANETNLPRVLLIVDSITLAYYPDTEKRLAEQAFAARLTTSRFVADPLLLKEISLVLDETNF